LQWKFYKKYCARILLIAKERGRFLMIFHERLRLMSHISGHLHCTQQRCGYPDFLTHRNIFYISLSFLSKPNHVPAGILQRKLSRKISQSHNMDWIILLQMKWSASVFGLCTLVLTSTVDCWFYNIDVTGI